MCPGGHTQGQIFASFMALWPTVKPGGLYFIEDLQVSRGFGAYQFREKERKDVSMMDYIYNWMGKLCVH